MYKYDMYEKYRIKNVFSPWQKVGIFLYLTLPEGLADSDQMTLLNNFFNRTYGMKLISPLVESFLDDDNLVMSESQSRVIAQYISYKYKTNWEHKYKLLKLEYNPIWNKDGTETETYSKNIDRTDSINTSDTNNETTTTNNTNVVDGTNLQTNDLTDTDTKNLTDVKTEENTNTATNTTDRDVWGFNSTSKVDSSQDSQSGNGTENKTLNDNITENNTYKKTGTLTDKQDSTDTFTGKNVKDITNMHEETNTNKENETSTRELKYSGNIGVTTTQEMMKQEVEFWKWNLLEDIMSDVANEISLQIY